MLKLYNVSDELCSCRQVRDLCRPSVFQKRTCSVCFCSDESTGSNGGCFVSLAGSSAGEGWLPGGGVGGDA